SSRSLCLPPARMHFWVFATRFHFACSVPRKNGLNWFMPALANSRVGSSSGTTGEDGTLGWPCFLQQKSMNCWRISFAVGISSSVVDRSFFGEPHRRASGVSRGSLNQELPPLTREARL